MPTAHPAPPIQAATLALAQTRKTDLHGCRNLNPGEKELKAEEKEVLDRICEAYYLPAWCSINDYKALFEAQGLKVDYLTFCTIIPLSNTGQSATCFTRVLLD